MANATPNVTLNVELTQDQYTRYQLALAQIKGVSLAEITDADLIAQLKREAAAITYESEVGTGDSTGWVF